MSTKKAIALGMNPSTASGRLIKDILFSLLKETGKDVCYRCSGKLSRDTFSVEHKKSWLKSENPKESFFDLDNIAFSHLSCNISSKDKQDLDCGRLGNYRRGCRCEECKKANADSERSRYTSDKRRVKYLKEKSVGV